MRGPSGQVDGAILVIDETSTGEHPGGNADGKSDSAVHRPLSG